MKKTMQVALTPKERALLAYAIYACTDESYGLESQVQLERELNEILKKLHKLTTIQYNALRNR